jgi:hypothetical protein
MLTRDVSSEFEQWLESYYADHFPDIAAREIKPTVLAFVEAMRAIAAEEVGADPDEAFARFEEWTAEYVAAYAKRHLYASRGGIRKVAREAKAAERDPVAAITERFDEWDEVRPGRIALRETVQGSNGVALTVFAGAGFAIKRWRAFGKSCPWCQSLDGKTVAITEDFAKKGNLFVPGSDAPLLIRRGTKHAPLHGGCDCQVEPG